MRLYFLWGSLASLGLVVALIYVMVKLLRVNWNRSNRSALSFLFPVILAVLVCYVAMTQFVPRSFDIIQILNEQYELVESEITEREIKRCGLLLDGEFYYVAPRYLRDLKSGRYQIYYTAHTQYVMKIIYVGEQEANLPKEP